jgi:hypothetical protein
MAALLAGPLATGRRGPARGQLKATINDAGTSKRAGDAAV